VRGTAANHLLDLRPDALRILNDLVRPEAHHAPTFAFHGRSAARIRLDLEGMVVAIDFDHQFSRYTGEIGEVRTNGMLPPELHPADAAISQELPDLAFRAASVAAQVACSTSVVIVSGHNPLT
jgi:hypothetical protein